MLRLSGRAPPPRRSSTPRSNPLGAALILGHGAGAGQHSAFMVEFAQALSALGLDVVTFNFLYTEQKRRLPDRAPVLEDCYRAIIEAVRDAARQRAARAVHRRQVDGRAHRDAGGRRRCDAPIAGLVLLGYPLHPPGQPQKLRDAHLPSVRQADAVRARQPRRVRDA